MWVRCQDLIVCLFISCRMCLIPPSLRSFTRSLSHTLTWPRTRPLRAHVDAQVDSFARFFIFLLEFLLDSGESLLQRRHLENFSSTIKRRNSLPASGGRAEHSASRRPPATLNSDLKHPRADSAIIWFVYVSSRIFLLLINVFILMYSIILSLSYLLLLLALFLSFFLFKLMFLGNIVCKTAPLAPSGHCG